MIEIAGPERTGLNEMVRRFLAATKGKVKRDRSIDGAAA
jgi:hypothetical protein